MNNKQSLLLLSGVIAVGLGIFGFSGSFGTISGDATPSMNSGATMLGHLTLTAYDEHGNIKAYQQTDNVVLNRGDDCISEKIFSLTIGDGCAINDNFDFVLIGTGGGAATSEGEGDPLPRTVQGTGLNASASGSVTLTTASGSGGASTLLSVTFADVNAQIDEAAIRNANGDSSGIPLAYQNFTAIDLGSNDDLTVDWTVTIDGN